MPAINLPSHMEIDLRYIADLDLYKSEKPYRINDIEIQPEDDIAITNIVFESGGATLHNLRGQKTHPNFEDCGFKYVTFTAKTVPGFDDESIIAYSNEAIELLQQHLTADKIICYDLRLRKNSLVGPKIRTFTDRSVPDEPIEAVHIDHTRLEGWSRVAHHLTTEEQEKYLNNEWHIKIFNIWKPLNKMIKDMPLAICDHRTISEDQLIAADQIGPGFNAEIYYVRPSKDHKWYWLRDQRSDEALLFQSWDSHPLDGQLNCCPHAAFKDPHLNIEAPLRESVEVRLITFTKLKLS